MTRVMATASFASSVVSNFFKLLLTCLQLLQKNFSLEFLSPVHFLRVPPNFLTPGTECGTMYCITKLPKQLSSTTPTYIRFSRMMRERQFFTFFFSRIFISLRLKQGIASYPLFREFFFKIFTLVKPGFPSTAFQYYKKLLKVRAMSPQKFNLQLTKERELQNSFLSLTTLRWF